MKPFLKQLWVHIKAWLKEQEELERARKHFDDII